MSSGVRTLNPNAETMGKGAALYMNINAAKGLQDVMKSNLGPKGTIKMLVDGALQIKLTKDGNVLLREMQIQNPTAVMIARTAVAQDDITGDGTTSMVLFIGELMKRAEGYIQDGLHPRVLVEGYELAKKAALEYLDSIKQTIDVEDREKIRCVARTSLHTKVQGSIAESLTDIVTDAVLCIRTPDTPIDLHMVEIMYMRHKLDNDTRLIRGIVLDHGARHPDMPKHLENCFILTCNLSLEYEKSEVNSSFFYSNAEQREELVVAERKFTDDRVMKVIELKKKVCKNGEGFVVVNMKGIDPYALDLLAAEGIFALRRAKKRNMERMVYACGGFSINSEEELTPECLGHAGSVYEHTLGEDVFTFVEDVKEGNSCSILIKGPNDHTIAQIKDAVRDGLRAVKNCIDDGSVIPGAGAFEIGCAQYLREVTKKAAKGKVKIGVEAFAEAILCIPKLIAENAGHDAADTLIEVQTEHEDGNGACGIDVITGGAIDADQAGIYDNFIVKRQILNSAPVVSGQLLLVDEIMRAGINTRRKA